MAVPAMSDEQFWELSERLRQIEAKLLTTNEGKPMIISELQTRLGGFFDKAYANAPGALTRTAIQRLRSFTTANLDRFKDQAELLFDDGRFASGVDFLMAFAKGNIGKFVPWYLRPFINESRLLDDLGTFLKANADLFKQGIGALPQTEKQP